MVITGCTTASTLPMKMEGIARTGARSAHPRRPFSCNRMVWPGTPSPKRRYRRSLSGAGSPTASLAPEYGLDLRASYRRNYPSRTNRRICDTMDTATRTYATGRRGLAVLEAAGKYPAASVDANNRRARERRPAAGLTSGLAERPLYDSNLAGFAGRTVQGGSMSRLSGGQAGSRYLLTPPVAVRTSSRDVAVDAGIEERGSGHRWRAERRGLAPPRDPQSPRYKSPTASSLPRGTVAMRATSLLFVAQEPSTVPVPDFPIMPDRLPVLGLGNGPCNHPSTSFSGIGP